MQDQGRRSNSSQANLYLNGSDQHHVFPNAGWNIGQSSSSLDTSRSNHVSFRQLLGDDLWLSPLGNQSAGTAQNETTIGLSQQANVRVSNGERGAIGGTPSSLLGQRNLDLNASGQDDHGDNGPNLTLDLFAADHNHSSIPPSSSGLGGSSASSSPLMIYSGIAGYAVEENISGEGEGVPVAGGRRLLCKRRAPDYASSSSISAQHQTSRNIIMNSSQQPAPVVTPAHTHAHAHDNVNVNATNVSPLTAAAASLNNSLHSSGHAAAQLQPTPSSNLNQIIPNQARNVRSRRSTPLQINPAPIALWTINSIDDNVSNNVQTMGQPAAIISPLNRFPNTSSGSAVAAAAPVTHQQPIGIGQPIISIGLVGQVTPTTSWQTPLQPSPLQSAAWRWQNSYNYLLNSSRSSRNTTTNVIPWMSNMQANLNLANANANNILGNNINASSSSSSRVQAQAGSRILHVPSPSSTMRLPAQPNISDQYAQRLQDIVALRQVNYCPIHSPAARNMDVSLRGGYARPAQVPRRSGSRQVAARATQQSGVSPTLTAQRRSRLISEVHNTLGLVRRGGVFRLEDVMVIDRSYLYGLPEVPDFHDDMRLDVDNMSYEELLDLQEQIGNVSTGLTEETILANMRRRKYQSIAPVEPEPCCICQEDYANGEELGKLDCGHDFHFNCIKQWLVQKNSCPICKKTALAI